MPVRRLTLTNFRNYHAASLEAGAKTIVLVGPNGAGKTNLIEAISFFAPGRGLRRATSRRGGVQRGRRLMGGRRRDRRARSGLATLGTGIERPLEDGATDAAQMPDRPRAGRLGRGLRRSSARGLAGAGDGHAVCRRAVRAPALSRPAGARGRCRAWQPGQRARTLAALAQPAAGGAAARCRIGSTPSSTRPRNLPSRSPACASKPCAGSTPCWRAAGLPHFRRRRSRSTAGWKS